MKKPVSILLLALLAVVYTVPAVVSASDISDAEYYGVIRITNNGTAATNVSVNVTLGIDDLIASGLIAADAANLTIRTNGNADTQFMPGYGGNPTIIYVPSIGANTSLDYIIYTNAPGGEYRYFPTSAAVADNASIELEDNFTLSATGIPNISTNVDKNILRKLGAYDSLINPTDTDNMSFTMFGANQTVQVHYSDSAESSYVVQEINPQYINTISFRVLNPVASGPQARLHVIQAYNSSNGSWVNPTSSNSSWTDNANALNGNTANYANDVATSTWTKWFTGFFNPPVESHQVRWYFSDVAGNYTTKQVIVGGLQGRTVSVASITATEQTINISSVSGANLTMTIDGTEVDTVSLGGISIPDNSNNLLFFNNSAFILVDSANISIDGAVVASWNPLWEYGATFTDSVSSIVMTPSFRTTSSHASVSAELISFSPMAIAASTGNVSETWPTVMTDPPDEPSTSYSENTTPGFFFAGLVTNIWNAFAADYIPVSFFWFTSCFIFILLVSMGTYSFFAVNQKEALFVKILATTAIMIFFALPGINVYGLVVPLYYGLFSIGAIMIKNNYGW